MGRSSIVVAIIRPSWLRVDRAIIFLRSHSTIATSPAISMVVDAVRRSIGFRKLVWVKDGEKRINR